MADKFMETEEFIIYVDNTPRTFHQYQKFLKKINAVEFTKEEIIKLFGELPPTYERPPANPMLRLWVGWSMEHVDRDSCIESYRALVFDCVKNKLARLNGNNYAGVVYKMRK